MNDMSDLNTPITTLWYSQFISEN